MKLFLIMTLVALVSCVQDESSPENVLKSFIDVRIGNVVTRSAVVEKTTGKLRQSLENVSDEDFKKFADLRNVERESFKILSKSCQENTCFLTYSISFTTKQDNKEAYQTEVKKIAELNLVSGKWLIADVTNIKTYHENLEPINALQ